MTLQGGNNQAFNLSTQAIGGPGIVTSGIGLLVVFLFIYRVSTFPDQLPIDGKIENVEHINKRIRILGIAISDGAKAFLHKEYTYLAIVVSFLFVLVSAAVHWETGLW
jgi:Na+/H+-translocating membrane pyrophosphatase